LIKPNLGMLEIQGASSFANNSFVEVSGGKLRFNVGNGSASVGTGALALIDNAAVLELAGSVSALSSGNRGVDLLNESTAAAGILVSGTNQRVGGIDGSGATHVNPGSDLTANHVIQSALIIGGTMDSPARVTIAASGSGGNPMVGDSLLADWTSAGFDASASLSHGPFSVPEPSSVALLGIGAAVLAGLVMVRLRAGSPIYGAPE
jgi:hypothetical protein